LNNAADHLDEAAKQPRTDARHGKMFLRGSRKHPQMKSRPTRPGPTPVGILRDLTITRRLLSEATKLFSPRKLRPTAICGKGDIHGRRNVGISATTCWGGRRGESVAASAVDCRRKPANQKNLWMRKLSHREANPSAIGVGDRPAFPTKTRCKRWRLPRPARTPRVFCKSSPSGWCRRADRRMPSCPSGGGGGGAIGTAWARNGSRARNTCRRPETLAGGAA